MDEITIPLPNGWYFHQWGNDTRYYALVGSDGHYVGPTSWSEADARAFAAAMSTDLVADADRILREKGYLPSADGRRWRPPLGKVSGGVLIDKIDALEAENAALKRELADLRAGVVLPAEPYWRRVSETPAVGGTYVVGGYVIHAHLGRIFERAWGSLFRTIDGPEWSIIEKGKEHVPIEFWFDIPAHPEHQGAHTLAAGQPAQGEAEGLLAWAVSRWKAEVENRPLQNVHRRALDTTWRQVIRRCGGDPDALVGPSHDDLVNAPTTTEPPR